MTATGFVQGLAPGQKVWLVHEPTREGKDYPDFCLTVSADGTWRQEIHVGDEVDSGTAYRLHLLVVDAAADRAFAEQAAEARTSGSYVGMPRPAGATRIASVSVVRR